MVRIPPWVWLAVALAAVLAVGIRQSMQAAYYRGVADDTEQRIEAHEVVLDSVSAHSRSLEAALEEADSARERQGRASALEVVRLTRERQEARERSAALTEHLRASLDSAQAVQLDDVVYNFGIQIAALDSVVSVERASRLAEALRADAASELVLGLREHIGALDIKSFMLEAQVNALRQSMKPSLGLRLKADWWLGVAGVAAGYLIWGTR